MQWHHSAVNIKIHKKSITHVQASSHSFRASKIFDLEKVHQGHGIQFLHCCHAMENIKIYKSRFTHFCASSQHFTDIKISKTLTIKKVVKEYNFLNVVFRWQISKSTKVIPCILVLALTTSEILTFPTFYL